MNNRVMTLAVIGLAFVGALFIFTSGASASSAVFQENTPTPTATQWWPTPVGTWTTIEPLPTARVGVGTFVPIIQTPTALPARDYSCPSGVPVGWGVVTPDPAWLASCYNCVPRPTLGVATVLPTRTPIPTRTPVLFGTPSYTGTVTATPTATATVTPSVEITSVMPITENVYLDWSFRSAFDGGSDQGYMHCLPSDMGGTHTEPPPTQNTLDHNYIEMVGLWASATHPESDRSRSSWCQNYFGGSYAQSPTGTVNIDTDLFPYGVPISFTVNRLGVGNASVAKMGFTFNDGYFLEYQVSEAGVPESHVYTNDTPGRRVTGVVYQFGLSSFPPGSVSTIWADGFGLACGGVDPWLTPLVDQGVLGVILGDTYFSNWYPGYTYTYAITGVYSMPDAWSDMLDRVWPSGYYGLNNASVHAGDFKSCQQTTGAEFDILIPLTPTPWASPTPSVRVCDVVKPMVTGTLGLPTLPIPEVALGECMFFGAFNVPLINVATPNVYVCINSIRFGTFEIFGQFILMDDLLTLVTAYFCLRWLLDS